jgi:hypothetical protein
MIKHFLCHLNQDKVSQFAVAVMNEPISLSLSLWAVSRLMKNRRQTSHAKLPGQSSAE